MACQASCKYCFGPHQGNHMTLKQWEKTLVYLKRMTASWSDTEIINIIFHGGEPLLAGVAFFKNVLKDLDDTFGSNRLKLSIQSNLWALSSEFIDLFKKYRVSIGTSLDGPEKINDAQRGLGYFQKTWTQIQNLRDNGMNAGIITTITPNSAKHFDEIMEFFNANEISPKLHPSIPDINDRELKHQNEFVLSPREYSKVLLKVLHMELDKKHLISDSIIIDAINFAINDTAQGCMYKDCLGSYLAIDPTGDLYPCQRFIGHKEYRLGNINSEDIEIWNSKGAKKLKERQKKLQEKAAPLPPERRKYILGGCPYQAFSEKDIIDPYWEAYDNLFKEIQKKYVQEFIELTSLDTTLSLKDYIVKFPITIVTEQYKSPSYMKRNAKKIVAAYLLGKYDNNLDQIVTILLNLKLVKSKASGLRSLQNLQKRIKPQQLNNLYLHITWDCNLNCKHCYASKSPNEYMDLNNIKEIMIEAQTLGFQKIVFTGGEPLVHPNFQEMLGDIVSIKKDLPQIKLVLRTNWIKKLTKQQYEQIALVFDEIIVSLDGDQESHDTIRGKGSYSITVANIKDYQQLTQKNYTNIELACTISDINRSKQDAVYEFAKTFDPPLKVRIRRVLPIGKGKELQLHFPTVSPSFSSPKTALNFLSSEINPSETCGIGNNLYVNPKGEAFPCYAYKDQELYYGNIFTDGINAIIHSDKFQTIGQHSVDKNLQCKHCDMRYLCGGGCQAWNKNKGIRALNDPPTFCNGKTDYYYQLAKKQVKIAKDFLQIENVMDF